MIVYLYLFAFALGGILLLASIFVGDKESGGDAHDAEGAGDAGDAGDAGAAQGAAQGLAHAADNHGGAAGLFTAFLSLRFWMFFLAFFGLTGLVLDGMHLLADSTLALVLSLAMGLLTGLATVYVLRGLAASETSTAASASDYVGKSGRVLVGFAAGQLGKLRLTLKGTTVDVLATSDEERPFAAGEEALVIQMNDTTAVVARVPGRAEAT